MLAATLCLPILVVVADNGVTTYQVTVNLAGLGFSLAERGRVILDVVDP